MDTRTSVRASASGRDAGGAAPSFRSGAVARLVAMPVATLRVWERRYAVSSPTLTPSGQRLYSSDDVRRLRLLKQLTDRGHAISSLAPLDMAQLQAVVGTLFTANHSAAAHRGTPRPEQQLTPSPPAAWRVAVVGAALAERLHDPALLRQVGRPLMVLGAFDTLKQAAKALKRAAVDVVLIEAASLHSDWLRSVDAEAPSWGAVHKAVLYGFASETVCAELDEHGVALLRAPQPNAVLGQWLRGLAQQPLAATESTDARPHPVHIDVKSTSTYRWPAAALSVFAKQASSVACECPQHLTELLTRLSDFETYSIECANQSPADADLHAYLRHTAAVARASFETALERVALHEGLPVPPEAD
jgi:MerR family transcriptional regulator, light-induced transcriptional regulator